MLTFLYVIQFIIAILLIIVVMFQKSEGGTGLINSNQANNFFSNKSFSTNPLSKITTVLGFLLFINCIVIAGVLVNKKKSDDILKQIEEKSVERKKLEQTNSANDTKKNSTTNNVSSNESKSTGKKKDNSLSVPLAK